MLTCEEPVTSQSKLTAPVALSWKRQAALLVGLPFGGFMLGFVFAMRIPA